MSVAGFCSKCERRCVILGDSDSGLSPPLLPPPPPLLSLSLSLSYSPSKQFLDGYDKESVESSGFLKEWIVSGRRAFRFRVILRQRWRNVDKGEEGREKEREREGGERRSRD
ncbi:hypothetical protein Ancab_037720 [Ancistrocladus abbreviatus]